MAISKTPPATTMFLKGRISAAKEILEKLRNVRRWALLVTFFLGALSSSKANALPVNDPHFLWEIAAVFFAGIVLILGVTVVACISIWLTESHLEDCYKELYEIRPRH